MPTFVLRHCYSLMRFFPFSLSSFRFTLIEFFLCASIADENAFPGAFSTPNFLSIRIDPRMRGVGMKNVHLFLMIADKRAKAKQRVRAKENVRQ